MIRFPVYGDAFVHVSKIDRFVESSRPLPNFRYHIGETELAIGRYCAELIEDGATLQLGIGAIPDAVLQALKDKRIWHPFRNDI